MISLIGKLAAIVAFVMFWVLMLVAYSNHHIDEMILYGFWGIFMLLCMILNVLTEE